MSTNIVSVRPRVVVVGAGFGGMNVVKQLAKAPVDVTIVDRNNFHTFQPLLYQVATAGLNAADVAYPVRGLFREQANVVFRQAAVTGVDRDLQEVELDGARLPYDHLVIAAGATTNWFGVDGAAEHAFPLYALTDAIALRNHVVDRFERADADPSLVDDGALTFVVVGGGPTGVEVAGALAELFDMVLRKDFPRLDVGGARVVLLEMSDRLLAPFHESSQHHARATLVDRGVEVRLFERVASVSATRVTLASGEEVPTHTVVWAAGVRASGLSRVLGIETGPGGRIPVDRNLRVEGSDAVYAIGDVAAIPDGKGGVLPQLAPVALQSGKHAAHEIMRTISGQPPKPFRYLDKGTMATIGRRAAVAELPLRIRLRGTLAWLSWLGLHLFMLMGFRNRLSVVLNWAWNYVTWDRGPRLIIRPDTHDE